MKALQTLTLGIFIITGMAFPEDAAAQFRRGDDRQIDRDRVCLYQDINYQGWEECYFAGEEVANLNGRRNHVSSIRVYGRARVTVYDQTNFRGTSAEFDTNVRDLGLRSLSGSRSWSDRIESFRVSSDFSRNDPYYRNVPGNGRAVGRGIGRGRRDRPGSRDGICVFEHANYQGRSQCWAAGDALSDLGRTGGWSDRISSIQIMGNAAAMVYRDIRFQGERLFIDRDIADLSRAGLRGISSWNDQISSLQIRVERGRFRGEDRE